MAGGRGEVLGSHHLYVHVPFCRLVCAYCDFVTVGGRSGEMQRYAAALLAELAGRPAPGALDTIYFGGGTPSLMPAASIQAVVQAAVERWGLTPGEVTIEANPSQREAPDWRGLRAAGVDRISLGVQSLRDPELTALARGQTADEARAAFAAARATFDNVSIDLIYGIPGQSVSKLERGTACGDRARAEPPVALCAAARPPARRVGRAATSRSASLAPSHAAEAGR